MKKTFLVGAIALCLLSLVAVPASAITSDPSVIAYDDGTGNYRIYAFARGDHGTLVVDFWSNWANASTWQWLWQDLGLPSGATYISNPSAVTYRGSNGIQYIAVFVTTDGGDLAVYHWDGSNWTWDDLNTGASSDPNWYGYIPTAQFPKAITYLDQYGNRQIKVFSVDNKYLFTGELWASSCDASCPATGSWQGHWQFHSVNIPKYQFNLWPSGAAHFIDSSGTGQTFVFAQDGDELGITGTINAYYSYDDYSSGNQYSWVGLGDAISDQVVGQVAITQDLDWGPGWCPNFHFFAVSLNNGHLFDNIGCRDTYFDLLSNTGGSYWVDDGLPSQFSGFLKGDAVGYFDPTGLRLDVFFSSGGELFRAFWSGAANGAPAWSDQGGSTKGHPSPIAFWQGFQYVYAFVRGGNDHLVVNFCYGSSNCDSQDPSAWQWADLGTM